MKKITIRVQGRRSAIQNVRKEMKISGLMLSLVRIYEATDPSSSARCRKSGSLNRVSPKQSNFGGISTGYLMLWAQSQIVESTEFLGKTKMQPRYAKAEQRN